MRRSDSASQRDGTDPERSTGRPAIGRREPAGARPDRRTVDPSFHRTVRDGLKAFAGLWTAGSELSESRRRLHDEVEVDVLDYPDVVDHIVRHRPGGHDTTSAVALLRERSVFGWTVRVCFLDADGKPLAAGRGGASVRTYHARRLDDELDSMFEGRDVLLLS